MLELAVSGPIMFVPAFPHIDPGYGTPLVEQPLDVVNHED
jgi:hypothetical protein